MTSQATTMTSQAEPLPAVLVNTSLCGEPSERMVASPGGVRSKVKVPEVVNCPDGDTVTVGGGQTRQTTPPETPFKCRRSRISFISNSSDMMTSQS